MASRDHIVYNHPANTDGFSYFYIAYRPGKKGLVLRYRRSGDDRREEKRMSIGDMLKFLAEMRENSNGQWPEKVVARAFLTLRAQVQRWRRKSNSPLM